MVLFLGSWWTVVAHDGALALRGSSRMWLLDNETPFAAERTWTRDEDGVEHWLVAIKASFDIYPDGKQVLSKWQVPVLRAPVFAGDPAATELLDGADFNLEKRRTDVLVRGHAYVSAGRPAEETVARLKVEQIDKSVRVLGDRSYFEGPVAITPTRPEPFLRMPLSWHRSYGGTDQRGRRPAWEGANPVGVGFAENPAHLVGQPAPNFEYPGRSDIPAGFGPIAPHWTPRARFAGTYDEAWSRERDPLPPRDFDRRFYQCAPEDQQTERPLVGYEEVRLGNLTPDGFWGFRLPRITFAITTQFYRRPDQRQEAAIHTLILQPDDRRFIVVWHSALRCPYDEERLKGTTITLRRRLNVPESVSQTGIWIP
jgi:hypothetical protein